MWAGCNKFQTENRGLLREKRDDKDGHRSGWFCCVALGKKKEVKPKENPQKAGWASEGQASASQRGGGWALSKGLMWSLLERVGVPLGRRRCHTLQEGERYQIQAGEVYVRILPLRNDTKLPGLCNSSI